MDVVSRNQWMDFKGALFGVVLWVGGAHFSIAQDQPAVPAPSRPAESLPVTSGAVAPGKEKYLDTGLLGRKLRLGGGRPAEASVTPPEPGIDRRELLRLRDEAEEKKNWAFLDPGQLKEERQLKEEGPIRDRWEVQEDLRGKEWWEYESSSARQKRISQARFEEDPRTRQFLRSRDGGAGERSSSLLGAGSASPTEKTSGRPLGAHQTSELSMKDLVGPGADVSRLEREDFGRDFGLNEIFQAGPMTNRERDDWRARRQEFRNFLNISRTGGRPDPMAGVPVNPAGEFRSPSSISSRDGFASPTAPVAPLAPRVNAFDGFNPPSPGADRSQGPAGYRALNQPRSYVTTEMLEAPKRRF